MSPQDLPSPDPAQVIFLSGDLIFASRVRAAAVEAGYSFSLAQSLPAGPSPEVRFVILDLSTRSKALDGLMDTGPARFPSANFIAYAPHVQVERLKSARQAGVPVVLTRGQFDGSLPTLFQS